jgi:GNAT superfamily N-acetyltransferase
MVHMLVATHVRDMTTADLEEIAWAGGPTHRRYVAEALARRPAEVDYLAVCGPADLPLAIGGIDYVARTGVATIWQLMTLPALRSCGLGTSLIAALEERAATRGALRVGLSVELTNPRAHALYERLGYAGVELEDVSWDTDDGHYNARCVVMTKDLVAPHV